MKRLLILLLLLSACAVAPAPTDAPRATDTPVPVATATSTATATLTPTFEYVPTREGTQAATVVLQPGDNLQARIDAAPAGATFAFAPGVYRRAHIVPRTGDVYEGLGGAVLDGGNTAVSAFKGIVTPNDPRVVRDVTIRGFTIQHYRSYTSMKGFVSPDGAIEGGPGWIIENNVIQDNVSGINLGRANWDYADGAIIRGNHILRNSEIGVEANGSNIIFEGNELAGNAWSLNDNDRKWSGGGSKFTDQPIWANSSYNDAISRPRSPDDGNVIYGNHVYDNLGVGLWIDVSNRNTLIENNVVENNYGSGIMDELSDGTTIRGNTLRNNRRGNTQDGLWGGAEVLIANSQRGRVTDNDVTVSGTGRGVIMIYETYRGAWPSRDYLVSGNRITFENRPQYRADGNPIAGILGGGGNDPFWASNNVYEDNQYAVQDTAARYWFWGTALTFEAFRAAGHEARGVVTTAALRSAAPVSFAETLGVENEGQMDAQNIQSIIQLVAFVVTIVVMLVVLRASIGQMTAFVKDSKDNPAIIAALKALAESFPAGSLDLLKSVLVALTAVTDDPTDALIMQVKELIEKVNALEARIGTVAEAKIEAAAVKDDTVAAANASGNYVIEPLPGTVG